MHSLVYYKNLDALRAFAALGVIVAHYFSEARFPEVPLVTKFAALGNTGVSLFFVLSGFVITRILLQTYESPHFFRSFYIRRALRIFPLYYAGLLIYFFATHFLDGAPGPMFQANNLYHVFYLQNIARTFGWDFEGPPHYWSLAVEEHFYLLWPAVVYFCVKKNRGTLLRMSIWIVVAVHGLRFVMAHEGMEIDVFTFTRLDQLVVGGLLALYESYGLMRSHKVWLYSLMLVSGILGMLLIEAANGQFIRDALKHSALAILFSGVVLLAVAAEGNATAQRLLQNAPIQFLGKISYGLYVWHYLCIHLYDEYLSGYRLAGFVVVVALTVLVSWISYRIVEEPFLRLKTRFA